MTNDTMSVKQFVGSQITFWIKLENKGLEMHQEWFPFIPLQIRQNPDNFREIPGTFPCPGNVLELSLFPGSVLNISGTCPAIFLDKSRKCSGRVRDSPGNFRKNSGHVQEMSGKNPGKFVEACRTLTRETSGKFVQAQGLKGAQTSTEQNPDNVNFFR